MQMTNPKGPPPTDRKSDREVPKSKKVENTSSSQNDDTPGELLEGEGGLGLSIMGGGGHA
jgi:hypothetical protein